MDKETIFQLLVLLVWVFGGRLLRALRGGSEDTKTGGEPHHEELDEGRRAPTPKPITAPVLLEDVDDSIWLNEENRDATELAPSPAPPKEFEPELSELGWDDEVLGGQVDFSEESERIEPPIKTLPSLFSEKSTSNTVLLDGFLLSEILGTPRAYQSLRERRFDEGPRVVKKR